MPGHVRVRVRRIKPRWMRYAPEAVVFCTQSWACPSWRLRARRRLRAEALRVGDVIEGLGIVTAVERPDAQ